MNHKIKDLQLDSIFTLIKYADYRQGTNIVKFSKGRYKLPNWVAKIVKLFKK